MEKDDGFIGYCPDLLKLLTEQFEFRFTYKLHLVRDDKYGAKVDGVWNGMIGELIRRVGLSICTMLYVFSERELTFTFAIGRRPSVCRLSSVTFVHPTEAIEIFTLVFLQDLIFPIGIPSFL